MTSEKYVRQDAAFKTTDGITLRGWYYFPSNIAVPVPAIVMAHGFGAIKEHFAFRFAEVFAAAGFAVLLYDHRGFGGSEGLPRHEIDPWQQIHDERDAITWLTLQPGVNAERLGVWGTSYSGGHALVLGAIDKRIKCVVAQVPTISGYQQSLRRVRPNEIAAMRKNFQADRKARYLGEAPAMRAIVPQNPGDPAINTGEDARAFYLSVADKVTEQVWKNAVTLRSAELSSEYEPGIYIPRIAPTPLLMIVADQDDVTPTDLALDAYRIALEPKQLAIISGGHFDPYQQKFHDASSAARDWFLKFLPQHQV
jgi:fermentation-respiration switch protein FrsA (DUF1100 family)